jgi:hypothetical protein
VLHVGNGAVEDVGGVTSAPLGSDAFPPEWTAALLEDISGYGLFGLSDDFLMQDMFTVAGGGDVGLLGETK